MRFLIKRKLTSYLYKKDLSSPDSWEGDHNAQHNMEDTVILLNGKREIFSFPAQTVANMPGCRHTDTIVPGDFFIKWDVPRRQFKGHVHGIVGAYDYDGQRIDEDSVEKVPTKHGAPVDWARWIFGHSTAKNDPAPEGEFTRHAWSAGCVITTPEKQAELYNIGTKLGFKRGALIPCTLIEVP
jgi:hypothetical protein